MTINDNSFFCLVIWVLPFIISVGSALNNVSHKFRLHQNQVYSKHPWQFFFPCQTSRTSFSLWCLYIWEILVIQQSSDVWKVSVNFISRELESATHNPSKMLWRISNGVISFTCLLVWSWCSCRFRSTLCVAYKKYSMVCVLMRLLSLINMNFYGISIHFFLFFSSKNMELKQ